MRKRDGHNWRVMVAGLLLGCVLLPLPGLAESNSPWREKDNLWLRLNIYHGRNMPNSFGEWPYSVTPHICKT